MEGSKAPGARCWECPLNPEPFVPAHGPMGSDTLILVGEAPGKEEVTEGRPFVGPSGRLIDAVLKEQHQDPENTYRTNVIACRPPGNREPTSAEIACCSPRLYLELASHPSQRVLAMGKTANEFFVPGFSMSDRGRWFDWRDKQVLPTWHPAYVLRKPAEIGDLSRDVRVVYRGPSHEQLKKPPEVRIYNDVPSLREALNQCPYGDDVWVSFDIETDQTTWYNRPNQGADMILMLSIAWCDDFAVVVDDVMLYDVEGTIPTLQEFFNRHDVKFCSQNGSFDMIFLESHFGLKLHNDFDTMVAHYVLDENRAHGLKAIAMDEFDLPDYEKELISTHLRSKNDYYSKIPFPQLSLYGSWDAVVTRALAPMYEKQLKDEGLYEWPFTNVLMPGQRTLMRMSLRGVAVDAPYLMQAGVAMESELQRLRDEARAEFGLPDLNLNAFGQVADILYNTLRLPRPLEKSNSTDHESLEKLQGRHPFVDLMLYYRRVAKLKSSYVDNMLEYVDVNGRVHSDNYVTGTEIGRIAAKRPALLTIPRPEETIEGMPFTNGAIIRGAIIPTPGRMMLVCDYSQAELRVVAVFAKEEFLLEAYRNERDFHTEVALAMFGPNFTKRQRVMCKMFNFSYVYGGNEYSFAKDAGLNIMTAKQFVRDYNRLMPSLAQYRLSQLALLKSQGYVSTLFGRRRRFPLLTNANIDDARKAAVHMPVAGTASDLTLMSAGQLLDDGVDVVLTVHDSIEAESDPQHAEETAHHVADTMRKMGEKHLPEVPWKVDEEVRDRWATPPNLW